MIRDGPRRFSRVAVGPDLDFDHAFGATAARRTDVRAQRFRGEAQRFEAILKQHAVRAKAGVVITAGAAEFPRLASHRGDVLVEAVTGDALVIVGRYKPPVRARQCVVNQADRFAVGGYRVRNEQPGYLIAGGHAGRALLEKAGEHADDELGLDGERHGGRLFDCDLEPVGVAHSGIRESRAANRLAAGQRLKLRHRQVAAIVSQLAAAFAFRHRFRRAVEVAREALRDVELDTEFVRRSDVDRNPHRGRTGQLKPPDLRVPPAVPTVVPLVGADDCGFAIGTVVVVDDSDRIRRHVDRAGAVVGHEIVERVRQLDLIPHGVPVKETGAVDRRVHVRAADRDGIWAGHGERVLTKVVGRHVARLRQCSAGGDQAGAQENDAKSNNLPLSLHLRISYVFLSLRVRKHGAPQVRDSQNGKALDKRAGGASLQTHITDITFAMQELS